MSLGSSRVESPSGRASQLVDNAATFDFIVPFRSRSTTLDWSSVCRLLEQTLASAENSSHRAIRILVVCHEIPDIRYDKSRCEFLQVDFEPPSAETIGLDGEQRFFSWMSDKGRKVLHGVERSRRDRSRYFMVLDADDLVSSRLVDHCLRVDHPNGYYLQNGYRLEDDAPDRICRRRNFYRECGSSIVLRTERAPFPDTVDSAWDLKDHFIRRYVHHAFLPQHMLKDGLPLSPVPFHAGIYRFHAENCYAGGFRLADTRLRSFARRLLTGRPVTASLRNEFAIDPPGG